MMMDKELRVISASTFASECHIFASGPIHEQRFFSLALRTGVK